jgi:hypothetical protein
MAARRPVRGALPTVNIPHRLAGTTVGHGDGAFETPSTIPSGAYSPLLRDRFRTRVVRGSS